MPATVQIVLALLVLKVIVVSPLVAVAVRVIAEAPIVTGVKGANVTVWLGKTVMLGNVSVMTGRSVGWVSEIGRASCRERVCT